MAVKILHFLPPFVKIFQPQSEKFISDNWKFCHTSRSFLLLTGEFCIYLKELRLFPLVEE